jgi:ubiquitin C-terminal hydrolase
LNIPNIFSGVNVEHSNDAGYTLDINLCDIPKSITLNEKSYELRGVIHFRRGNNNLRNSVGHYTTYVRRSNEHWELFDDLKKKPIPVKETTNVSCEIIMYSI